MHSKESLKQVIHQEGLSRKDQTLLILASDTMHPMTVSQIRQLALEVGLRAAQKWNISRILGDTNGLAIRVQDGWELSSQGKAYLASQELISTKPTAVKNVINDLRQYIIAINSPQVRGFLEEAIGCVEDNYFRAAVILSWTGAIAVLYDHVVKNHLAIFNNEAKRRDAKWKDAKNADDLARMKEYDFLEILEALSVIGKNVKQELQDKLKLRNACGHPNSLQIGQNTVTAHIEILIQNVFMKF